MFLNEVEIKNHIRSLIQQCKNSVEVESDKVDFKLKWPNLNKESEIMEFTKDLTAIANSAGGAGFLIFGVDSKNGIQKAANFKVDSGLKDLSHLHPKINSLIEPEINFNYLNESIDGNNVDIIYIPPSNTKPHLIKNYKTYDKNGTIKCETKNKIFVRRGTSCREPNSYELSEIYKYRHEVTNEFEVLATVIQSEFAFYNSSTGDGNFNEHLNAIFVLENIGYRPIAISEIELLVDFQDGTIHQFEAGHYNKELIKGDNLKQKPILISPNQLLTSKIGFKMQNYSSREDGFADFLRKKQISLECILRIINHSSPLKVKCKLV